MPLVPALAQQVCHVIHQRVNQPASCPACAARALHALSTNARLVGLAFERDNFRFRAAKRAGLQPVTVVNQVVHVIPPFLAPRHNSALVRTGLTARRTALR